MKGECGVFSAAGIDALGASNTQDLNLLENVSQDGALFDASQYAFGKDVAEEVELGGEVMKMITSLRLSSTGRSFFSMQKRQRMQDLFLKLTISQHLFEVEQKC